VRDATRSSTTRISSTIASSILRSTSLWARISGALAVVVMRVITRRPLRRRRPSTSRATLAVTGRDFLVGVVKHITHGKAQGRDTGVRIKTQGCRNQRRAQCVLPNLLLRTQGSILVDGLNPCERVSDPAGIFGGQTLAQQFVHRQRGHGLGNRVSNGNHGWHYPIGRAGKV
jgi:hypothetical protein